MKIKPYDKLEGWGYTKHISLIENIEYRAQEFYTEAINHEVLSKQDIGYDKQMFQELNKTTKIRMVQFLKAVGIQLKKEQEEDRNKFNDILKKEQEENRNIFNDILKLLDQHDRHYNGKTALFYIGQEVRITKEEPDLGSWTWMDGVRKERKGERGIVVDRTIMDESKNHSPFEYAIRFNDTKIIYFVEEHIERLIKI